MNNSDKIILDLCGGSGSWAKPYKEAGYNVVTITLPDNDVRTYQPPKNVYGILAAPPCESFSFAPRPNGKSSKGSHHSQELGLEVVNACLRIVEKCKPTLKFWALENPVGELRKFMDKPRLTFQPYEYGDGWTKRTDIWGEFNIPQKTHTWETCPKVNCYKRPNRGKPSIAFSHLREILEIPQMAWAKDYCKNDYDARSITPPAFAKAFYESNK